VTTTDTTTGTTTDTTTPVAGGRNPHDPGPASTGASTGGQVAPARSVLRPAGQMPAVIGAPRMCFVFQFANVVPGLNPFFLAEQGTPGLIVEVGPTTTIFDSPTDSRTSDYVHGRFGWNLR
jgi:hypothetical protein